MGFVFTDERGKTTLSITDEWYEDLKDVFETLDPAECLKEEDMQIGYRYFVANEDAEKN